MPYGNRMGPDGMGPGTGRRLGFCAGYDRPGCANNAGYTAGGRGMGRGRGLNRGAGFGRGAGAGFYVPAGRMGGFDPDFAARGSVNEMEFLKGQEQILETELAALKERIKTAEEKE